MDNELIKRLTDDQARAEINKLIPVTEMVQIKTLTKTQRNKLISEIKRIEGLTQGHAARILGISPSLVFKS